MENAAIARVLNEVADLLDIQAANPFRVRAYRSAAQFVEGRRASRGPVP
jgi:DNA polymerase (family X)